MKKFLIIPLLFLLSCSNKKIVYGEKIVQVDKYNDTLCIYYTEGTHLNVMTWDGENPSFIAPIYLFNVGDTVYFKK